jgi:class 3 adenylate cyclase
MRLRDGTTRQRLLLATVVWTYALGVVIALTDHASRIGTPDPGWNLVWSQPVPTRPDAAEAGLRGGGRVLAINGVELAGRSVRDEIVPRIRLGIGETNTLRMERVGQPAFDLILPVRERTIRDVLYAEGGTMALAVLFFLVGLWAFVLRPWEPSSWALLALCTAFGGTLWNLFPDMLSHAPLGDGYHRSMVGLLGATVVHAALAFPTVHPALARGPVVVLAVYSAGVVNAVAQLHAWHSEWSGAWAYLAVLDQLFLLLAILFFVARCAVIALHRGDALAAQRARILLAGAVFGGALPVVLRFLQFGFGRLDMDPRISYWSLAILLLALARTTLRPELMNARVAVQRAAIYGMGVMALTGLAVALSSISPYAVAVLLLPLLYLWPRFEARLNERFYPKRAHLPELVRGVAAELGGTNKVTEVLDVLARGVERIFDARGAAAFLFPDGEHPLELGTTAAFGIQTEPALQDEPLIQLMTTTRREVFRDHVQVEPQYQRIRDACYRCFDRLEAELIVPIIWLERVIGGLSLGPRTTGDPYDAFEVEILHAMIQTAVQDFRRIRVTERLRERELEFQDLGRFFPPQVIEQVMARGGAAELRSQRKRVTVVFADLRGFTSFSERVEPEEVMATLAEYHAAMGARISEYAGTLERFAGDGFMVFFNDPVEQPDHAERAARMTLAMLADVTRMRERWARVGYEIHIGMGIATGYATVGFVGYEGRRDYGVIGNVTNLASRLSDQAAPGEVLVSAVAATELPEALKLEEAGDFTLKGFSQPQRAFRLLRDA